LLFVTVFREKTKNDTSSHTSFGDLVIPDYDSVGPGWICLTAANRHTPNGHGTSPGTCHPDERSCSG